MLLRLSSSSWTPAQSAVQSSVHIQDVEARVRNVQKHWPEVDKLMAAVAAATAAAGSQTVDQGWRAAADQASQAMQMLQEGYCSSRQVPCAPPLSQRPHCTPGEWPVKPACQVVISTNSWWPEKGPRRCVCVLQLPCEAWAFFALPLMCPCTVATASAAGASAQQPAHD
jgi:hypothetical protein